MKTVTEKEAEHPRHPLELAPNQSKLLPNFRLPFAITKSQTHGSWKHYQKKLATKIKVLLEKSQQ